MHKKPRGIYFPSNLNLGSITVEKRTSYTFAWDYWVYKAHTHFENKEIESPKSFVLSTNLS